MTIQAGDRIPDVQLSLATPEGPVPVRTGEYFAGKKVALFAVPGAYTPTCSARHLPSYVEKAAELKGKGIDEIVATSVNDAFVLGAWNKEQGSEDITMLADGNGELAEALDEAANLEEGHRGYARGRRRRPPGRAGDPPPPSRRLYRATKLPRMPSSAWSLTAHQNW